MLSLEDSDQKESLALCKPGLQGEVGETCQRNQTLAWTPSFSFSGTEWERIAGPGHQGGGCSWCPQSPAWGRGGVGTLSVWMGVALVLPHFVPLAWPFLSLRRA